MFGELHIIEGHFQGNVVSMRY